MLEGGADERFPSTKHIYMPSILSLNLAIVQFLIIDIVYPYPAYDARMDVSWTLTVRVSLFCVRFALRGAPSWEGRSRNKYKSFSLRLVPFAFPSAGSPIMPAHTAPCTRPHIVSVDSTPISASRVWRSV